LHRPFSLFCVMVWSKKENSKPLHCEQPAVSS
jgi:hypothetical protein